MFIYLKFSRNVYLLSWLRLLVVGGSNMILITDDEEEEEEEEREEKRLFSILQLLQVKSPFN